MSEFIYLIRGGKAPVSPGQMQRRLQKWLAWMSQLDSEGRIRDRGHPLEVSGKVVTGKQKNVSEGPYAEYKDEVGGYMLIDAQDLPSATEIAKGCPILDVGGAVEVRPIQLLTK